MKHGSRVLAAVQLKVMTIKKAMMEVLVIGMAVTSETNSGHSTRFPASLRRLFYTVSVSLVFLKVQGPMMMVSGKKVIRR
uniref:Uncharacterized protein n=1 Tax=Helianthus annuus TaxID=4232 RepID=A0A251THQ3_HELAN